MREKEREKTRGGGREVKGKRGKKEGEGMGKMGWVGGRKDVKRRKGWRDKRREMRREGEEVGKGKEGRGRKGGERGGREMGVRLCLAGGAVERLFILQEAYVGRPTHTHTQVKVIYSNLSSPFLFFFRFSLFTHFFFFFLLFNLSTITFTFYLVYN